MLEILSQSHEIQSAQQQFTQTLIQSAFTEKLFGKVNCMGGKFETDLYYAPAFNLWYLYELRDGKHWNAFGEGKPGNKALRINCEINLPSMGINRAMAAAFAKDENNLFYLLHRGKIRGGKALFFQHYQGQIVQAQEDKGQDDFALVARFDQALAPQIASFIDEVLAIKAQK